MKIHNGDKEDHQKNVEERFIERLQSLSRGDLAILKRNAGYTIADSRSGMEKFFRILPFDVLGGWNEEIYYLVATLYGLNRYEHNGDFGSSMRKIKQQLPLDNESIDRRMSLLIGSTFDLVDGFRPGGGETSYRLRQCVKLAAHREVGVNWKKLVKDLCGWTHPEKYIQKRWARSYFGYQKKKK